VALDLQHNRRHRAGPEQLGERARAEVAHAERRRAPGVHRLLHRSPHGAHLCRVADGPVEHEHVGASAAELGEAIAQLGANCGGRLGRAWSVACAARHLHDHFDAVVKQPFR